MNPATTTTSDGTGAFADVRRSLALLDPAERRKWWALVGLGMGNALLEAAAATLVFTLVGLIAEPDRIHTTIGVRTLYGWSPWKSDSSFLVALAVGIAVYYALKNSSLLLEVHLQLRRANSAASSVATRLLAGYLAAPYDFHFRRNSAELIRNVNYAVDQVYRSLMLSAVGMLSESLVILGIVAVLVTSAPLVTPLAIGSLGLLLGAFYRVVRPYLGRWGQETQDLSRVTLELLQDSLGSVKEVKVLGRERFFVEQFRDRRDDLARVFWRSGTSMQLPRFVIETLFVVALAVIVALVMVTGSNEGNVVPLLGLYAYAGFRLMPSANRMLGHVTNLRYSHAAVELVAADAEVLGDEPDFPPTAALPFQDRLEVKGVSFRYPGTDVLVLRDIDLVVTRGESVGIVGSTGAGKSTLLDLVMGLLTPEAGQITVDGVDITARPRAWQANIGYVAQSTWLLDDTLRRNIAIGVADDEVDDEAVATAVRLAQLGDVVASTPGGLDGAIGERGIRLSGGQRQRVAIARALYHDPEVLVFDEATSALDNRTEREVNAAIASLAHQKTILVIAHRTTSVQVCDRILFLDGGRVADSGSFDELLARNPTFRRTVDPAGSA